LRNSGSKGTFREREALRWLGADGSLSISQRD